MREKIRAVEAAVGDAFRVSHISLAAFDLGRDVRVVPPSQLPPKPGISKPIGQARLLHDLASIELQAMELAMRTLFEFPEAPRDFREQLSEIALGEARHLGLCLDGIESLGHRWGEWDVHLLLWNVVASEDTLLDRILIVHRYLEGSGLDAGDSILKRLKGVGPSIVRDVVGVIVSEEVDHVLFGSRWYRKIAEELRVDPEKDFVARISEIARVAPRRERIARDLRARAGFTELEMNALEETVQAAQQILAPSPRVIQNISSGLK